jgi:hypothetical protein
MDDKTIQLRAIVGRNLRTDEVCENERETQRVFAPAAQKKWENEADKLDKSSYSKQ